MEQINIQIPCKEGINSKYKLDETHEEILRQINSRYPLVFAGFSGLGYNNKDYLKQYIKDHLHRMIDIYGIDNLIVISGATKEGIGLVYDIAKELNLKTLGIVSEEAKKYPDSISSNCDYVIYIKDYNGTWKVVDENNQSYTVFSAHGGNFYICGGGDIAVSELKEAQEYEDINVIINSSLSPDHNKYYIKNQKTPTPYKPVENYLLEKERLNS